MDGYILDTSVLSAHLDPEHQRHVHIRQRVRQLEDDATLFLSAVSLAELRYGVKLAEIFGHARLPTLQKMLADARSYPLLDVTRHTAAVYADVKTTLVRKYFANTAAETPPTLDRRLGRPNHRQDAADRRKRPLDVRSGERTRLFGLHGRRPDEAHFRC